MFFLQYPVKLILRDDFYASVDTDHQTWEGIIDKAVDSLAATTSTVGHYTNKNIFNF